MRTKLIGFIAAAGCAIVTGQERFDLKVRSYFFAGVAGNMTALDKGMKMCEEALAADPKNAEALVWLGSGRFIQSRGFFQKGDRQHGQELWTQGLKEMDEAVVLAPDSVGVRIPRGATLLTASRYLPSPEMARPLIERGVSDYEKSYEIQSGELDQLGAHSRGELLIGLADGYSRLGETEKAAKMFDLIRTSLKGTAYEQSANAWFETKTLTPAQGGCLGCHTGK
jgi:hypothetical protein